MKPPLDQQHESALPDALAHLNRWQDAFTVVGQPVPSRTEPVSEPTGDQQVTPESATEAGSVSSNRRRTRAERKTAAAAEELRRLDIVNEIAAKRADFADTQRKRAEDRERERRDRKKAENSAAYARWMARFHAWRRTLVLVGAIVGVNIVAVVGQVTAFSTSPDANGFGWSLPQALATAAVIESIAIYVGWHAHIALIEGDSVARLRLTSYGIAGVVAALNYHHYAADWAPTDKAVMFGMASLLSPWLWAIHSRHLHRSQLRAAGLIDPRAPKFSGLRWLLHRSETWQALKWAVRHSEQSPTAAILAIQNDQGLADAALSVDRAHVALAAGRDALIQAQADTLAATDMYVTVLEKHLGEVSLNAAPPQPEITPVPDTAPDDLPDTSDVSEVSDDEKRERPDALDNREAEKWIRAAMRKGRTPKQADIAAKFGFSNGWASLRVRAARADLSAEGYRFLVGNRVIAPLEAATSGDAADVSDDAAEMAASAPTGDQS